MSLGLIGLGSNLGDRSRSIEEALAELKRHPDIDVVKQSRHYQTQPAGGPSTQPEFLNAAAVLQTPLPPQTLLAELQKVETGLGRQRIEHWGPRTIDLDLLLYDDLVWTEPELVIPHPRMAWRRFVLEPAAEVAADMIHSATGWTIARHLDHLNQTPWYLAITGPIGVGKTSLAGNISQKTGALLLAEQFDPSRLEAFYRNPSSHAWQIELEFLEQRARQLAISRPEWARSDRPTVSDFWFSQSLAFASVWLEPEQFPAYYARWTELQATVIRPRLIVLFRAPVAASLAGIRTRGRRGEEFLTLERLQQIEFALEKQAAASDAPVLRLNSFDQNSAITELAAALEAMH